MDRGAWSPWDHKESDMTEQLSTTRHRIKWKCFKNRTLDIKILKKIRDEKKFNNLEELKAQISKDVAICLK